MVEATVDTFRRNIAHFYPGKEPDPKIVNGWRQQALDHHKRKLSMDEVDSAWKLAVSKPLAPTLPKSSANSSMSFSLDQLLNGGGGGFGLPVTWDQVKGASGKEQLKLLQKIEYIDDVSADWDDYMELLKLGLEGDPDNFIPLHRKWFGLARTNSEYLRIQSGLAKNLVEAVRNRVESTSIGIVQRIVALVHAMGMDWMVRDETIDQSDASLLRQALEDWSFSTGIKDTLVDLDPCAGWYRLLLARYPAKKALEEVNSSSGALKRCLRGLLSRDIDGPLSAKETYILCMVHGMLAVLRVSMFPWTDLGVSRCELQKLYAVESNNTTFNSIVAKDAAVILSLENTQS